MTESDIERYLASLGHELSKQGIQQPVRVLLLGGAFMLTQIKARRTTDDIDVLPLDQTAPDPVPGIPLSVALWNAAAAVAAQFQLPSSWFNTLIADFVRAAGSAPVSTLWRTYEALQVYLPPPEYVFVLKLIANRQKDRRDIEALCQQLQLQTKQQAAAVIDSYIPDTQVQALFAFADTLEQFFPS